MKPTIEAHVIKSKLDTKLAEPPKVDIERLLEAKLANAKRARFIEHLGVILVILFAFAIIFLTP